MPKAFAFRLEPVLKFRRIVEENKKKDLALARRAIEEQRMALERLHENEAQGKERLKGLLVGEVDIAGVRVQMGQLHAVARSIREGNDRMTSLRQREEEKREIFVKARKDVRVLEKLRERRKEGYDVEMRRLEQKFLDDVAIGIRRFRAAQEGATA